MSASFAMLHRNATLLRLLFVTLAALASVGCAAARTDAGSLQIERVESTVVRAPLHIFRTAPKRSSNLHAAGNPAAAVAAFVVDAVLEQEEKRFEGGFKSECQLLSDGLSADPEIVISMSFVPVIDARGPHVRVRPPGPGADGSFSMPSSCDAQTLGLPALPHSDPDSWSDELLACVLAHEAVAVFPSNLLPADNEDRAREEWKDLLAVAFEDLLTKGRTWLIGRDGIDGMAIAWIGVALPEKMEPKLSHDYWKLSHLVFHAPVARAVIVADYTGYFRTDASVEYTQIIEAWNGTPLPTRRAQWRLDTALGQWPAHFCSERPFKFAVCVSPDCRPYGRGAFASDLVIASVRLSESSEGGDAVARARKAAEDQLKKEADE